MMAKLLAWIGEPEYARTLTYEAIDLCRKQTVIRITGEERHAAMGNDAG